MTERLLAQARAMGAEEVLLDTGAWLTPAIAMYRGMGFREIGRYPDSENDPALEPHLVYMALRL